MSAGESRQVWLVAHDLSAFGEAAATSAAEDIAGRDICLRLAHAVSTRVLSDDWDWSTGEAAGVTWEAYVEEARVEARQGLSACRARLLEAHPELLVELRVIDGDPAESILSAAAEPGVSRVVMGTHGRTGLKHMVLGSVAEAVMRAAQVPVLVVKAPN